MAFSVDRNIQNARTIRDLAQLLQKLFIDLEDSLNGSPAIQSDLTGTGYQRASPGDLLVSQTQGNITFKFVIGENSNISVTVGPAITDLNLHYRGQTSTTSNPTVTEYPTENDWGFHTNSTTGKVYLTLNLAGVIKIVELV